jgi:uncharacterized protein (UPF0335 family)
MTEAISGAHLRAFIERVERLEEEKKALGDDIKDVYAEAKGNGFDPRIMRKVVALRRIDADKRREQQEILDLYLGALGMLADTPPGSAALRRAVTAFGEPTPLTDEEKGRGCAAAFVDKRGARVAFGVGRKGAPTKAAARAS